MNRADAQAELYARLRLRSGFADAALGGERLRMLLASRATELRLADAGEVALLALGDPAEYARIEAHFAPPETWLFRYRESFELIREFAAARGANRPRALVLGAGGWCEPVSVACALAAGGWSGCVVLAVDRNPQVFAREPRFVGIELRGGLPSWAESQLTLEGDALVATPGLRAGIEVRVGDALDTLRACAGRGERFDIILFRNVAIYMGDDVRRAVFAAIPPVLAENGILLVGHAEVPAAAAATGLEAHGMPGSFALRARSPGTNAVHSPAATAPASSASPWSPPSPPPSPPPRRASADASVDPVAQLHAAIAASPTDAALHVRLALALAERGDRTVALETAMRALYLDRHNEEALLLAARISAERGAHADAERFRNRALRAHLERARSERDA